MVLTSNKCFIPYCDKLPCSLKRVFLDIAECKFKTKALVSILDVKNSIESQYKSFVVIENIFDCLQILSHAISNSTCVSFSENADIFDMKVLQVFECKCGSQTEVFNDPLKCINFYIEDNAKFASQNIEEIIRMQMSEKTYKVCSKKLCNVRESKRNLKLISTGPDCIVIRFIWRGKSEPQRVHDLIKPNLRLSDIINAPFEDKYNLVAILSQDDMFYYNKREWIHSYRNFFDIKQMVNYITCKQQVVDMLIFEKPSRIVENYKSTVREIEENKTPTREIPKGLYNTSKDIGFTPSIKKWFCIKCKTLNHDSEYLCIKCHSLKASSDPWTCKFCGTSNILASTLCKSCRNERSYVEQAKVDFAKTRLRCEKCYEFTEKGGICNKCFLSSSNESLIKPLSSSMNYYFPTASEKKNTSQVMCSVCRSVTCTLYLCIACLETSTSNYCSKCKKDSKFVCMGCYKSNKPIVSKGSTETPARRSKSMLKATLCFKCKNSITNSEKRNCVNCKKRVMEFPCKKCNSAGTNNKYACDRCFIEIAAKNPTRTS